jgi:hypothetical protein
MSDGGKGSKPRPYSVSQAEYDSRWDAIFCRDLKDDESPDSKQSEKTDAEKHETKT